MDTSQIAKDFPLSTLDGLPCATMTDVMVSRYGRPSDRGRDLSADDVARLYWGAGVKVEMLRYLDGAEREQVKARAIGRVRVRYQDEPGYVVRIDPQASA